MHSVPAQNSCPMAFIAAYVAASRFRRDVITSCVNFVDAERIRLPSRPRERFLRDDTAGGYDEIGASNSDWARRSLEGRGDFQEALYEISKFCTDESALGVSVHPLVYSGASEYTMAKWSGYSDSLPFISRSEALFSRRIVNRMVIGIQ